MNETTEQAPATPQWVAAHANALLYEVLSQFEPVGGHRASVNVDAEQHRVWREQAIHLSDIAAHPDYGREL